MNQIRRDVARLRRAISKHPKCGEISGHRATQLMLKSLDKIIALDESALDTDPDPGNVVVRNDGYSLVAEGVEYKESGVRGISFSMKEETSRKGETQTNRNRYSLTFESNRVDLSIAEKSQCLDDKDRIVSGQELLYGETWYLS